MAKLTALIQFLLALAGCGTGATTYVDHTVLPSGSIHSRTVLEDGTARFECIDSSSGACHFTLYPVACSDAPDCGRVPLRHFSVVRGESLLLPGLPEFRPCVRLDAALPQPDCLAAREAG